ncbi:hypothetical protein ABT121_32400 [Streptomyces sp. NPDC001928]|uniref:hypothetical protein n=1 Tax=Streptomyces sp. NPDC001928 TaxID=3154404 RepID=UPI00331DA9DE
MRRWLKAATVAASLVLFGAQSAVASDTVGWKTVSTNSNWYCGAYVKHSESYEVGMFGLNFKACTVVNSSGGAQAVLVAQNANELHRWYMQKGRVVFESQLGGDIWCAASNLESGLTRGCYAPTVPVGKCQRVDAAYVEMTIGGVTERAYGRPAYTPC